MGGQKLRIGETHSVETEFGAMIRAASEKTRLPFAQRAESLTVEPPSCDGLDGALHELMSGGAAFSVDEVEAEPNGLRAPQPNPLQGSAGIGYSSGPEFDPWAPRNGDEYLREGFSGSHRIGY